VVPTQRQRAFAPGSEFITAGARAADAARNFLLSAAACGKDGGVEPTPAIPAARPSPIVPGDDAPLFHLVYVSAAVAPFSEAELLALLERSRTNNARCAVTGLLLYHEGNFMQALEGPEPAVRTLHARIVTDPRHYGCITLIQGPIDARSFAGWSMGFRQLNVAHADSAPGYSDFLNYRNPLRAPPLEPGRAWQLLASFRRDLR